MRTLILLGLFLVEPVFAIPAGIVLKGDKQAKCAELLVRHVESAKHEPWASLPDKLKSVKAATLMVLVDLSAKGGSWRQLNALISPVEGIQFLEGSTVSSGGKVYFTFVAQGSGEALTRLHQRIAATDFSASFQFLDFEAAPLATIFPSQIIMVDDSYGAEELKLADEQIASQIKMNSAVAVYNVTQGQVLFIYPRMSFGPEKDVEFFAAHKIKYSWMRRSPLNWASWILENTQRLDKKMAAVLGSDRVILSATSFELIYSLARVADASLPKLEGVDGILQRALRECFSSPCEVTPQSREGGAARAVAQEESEATAQTPLTAPSRRRILDFLKAYRGSLGLSEPNGIRQAFVGAGKSISAERAAEAYRKEIRGLDFSAYEYQLIRKPESGAAQERFAAAWRALLRARASGYAELPLTFSNVVQAIKGLDEEAALPK